MTRPALAISVFLTAGMAASAGAQNLEFLLSEDTGAAGPAFVFSPSDPSAFENGAATALLDKLIDHGFSVEVYAEGRLRGVSLLQVFPVVFDAARVRN